MDESIAASTKLKYIKVERLGGSGIGRRVQEGA
jgi:hypothetical protein